MRKNVMFTLLAMLYLLINIVVSLNSSNDEYALLVFKYQITDPNKILAKNWSQGTLFCNWIGITYDRRHQRVRALKLADMGLGEIDLKNNSLSRCLSMDICYNLPKLERLRISVNQLSGNIPQSLGTCMDLKLLSLSFNIVVPSHHKIISLTYLSYNGFSGSIPYGIGNSSTLQYLYLGENILTGIIPHSVGSLSNLKELAIDNNRLRGQIPNSIFNLSMLQIFSLSGNSISGNLPSSIANGLPNLEILYLGANRLSGEILASISNFSKLTGLDLVDNFFSGQVPMNLGNLRNLRILSFSRNQLTNDP
ncbi:probable LRR receptor-like serine threonine-kinase At3g47570 [Olea europaea subsp. europaea]|uniref:Probable LRR receptor-like serine threonine-kinase At3g47570 n=1 Tax=Olea europaea subsp. europaea TaxID=158383 RepID=A0A8S0SV23_OLEEU|nr:probable LRR receptor-like serine threonine-kinase At3g47570 [Olea europaea subsp. europaea]